MHKNFAVNFEETNIQKIKIRDIGVDKVMETRYNSELIDPFP